MYSALLVLFFLSTSALLFFLATAAMVRLPDVYTRMNVLTKALALAMAGVAGALVAQAPGLLQGLKILAVWFIIHYSGLIARRWLLRTASNRSVAPWEL